ncbi:hypothetical protein MXD81_13590, partial [Microbacteriaceae bacterium K1510]|nr:hypothetical protein [Microbacteriaceae bacterium K1510]
NKLGVSIVAQWAKEIHSQTGGLTLAPYSARSVETPPFAEELPVAAPASLQATLNLFKNPRDFFEQDGKAKMRDELEKLLQQPVVDYLAAGGAQLEKLFAAHFAELVAIERARVATQVEEYF